MASKEEQKMVRANSLNIFLNKNLKILRVVVFILILLFASLILLQPKITKLSQKKSGLLKQQQEELKGLEQYYQGLEKLGTTVNNFKKTHAKNLDKLVEILPLEAEVPNLMAQLEAVTQASGFRITSLEVTEGQADKSGEAESKEATTKTETKDEVNLVNLAGFEPAIHVLNISLMVTGGDYLEFKKLLENLEKHLRIIDPHSVSFSSEVGEGKYNLSLRTYYAP